MLQPRKLILHSLMLDPKLGQRPVQFLGLRPHPGHSPMRSRTTPIRSACVKRSNESGGGRIIHSLNHTFQTLTPLRPEISPYYRS